MNIDKTIMFDNQLTKNVLTLTKPNGPILGARDDVAPTSPPTHLMNTKIQTNC